MNLHTTLKTLPIFNWQEIVNTGNLGYLYSLDYRNGATPPDNYDKEQLTKLWNELQFEMPDIKGIDNEKPKIYTEIVLNEWYKLRANDLRRINFYKNRLNKLYAEFKELNEEETKEHEHKEIEITEILNIINIKLTGINLNQFTTSTYEFWKAYNLYIEYTEAEKEHYNKIKNKRHGNTRD